MTQETQEIILHGCNRIMTIVENNEDILSSDDIEDLHFFVSHIENAVYLDKLKKTLSELK
jgi:hypothetical protein